MASLEKSLCFRDSLPHKGHCVSDSNAAKNDLSLSNFSAWGNTQHGKVNKVKTAALKLHQVLIKPPPEQQEVISRTLICPQGPVFTLI